MSCLSKALRPKNKAPQNPRKTITNTTLKRVMSQKITLASVLVCKPVVLQKGRESSFKDIIQIIGIAQCFLEVVFISIMYNGLKLWSLFECKFLASERRPKSFRPERNPDHSLCDAGAIVYQLSYQANWELVVMWVCA